MARMQRRRLQRRGGKEGSMTAAGILEWTHDHTEEETLKVISTGEEIVFQYERMSTSEPMVLMAIRAAYLYYAVEEDRQEDFQHMVNQKILEAERDGR